MWLMMIARRNKVGDERTARVITVVISTTNRPPACSAIAGRLYWAAMERSKDDLLPGNKNRVYATEWMKLRAGPSELKKIFKKIVS